MKGSKKLKRVYSEVKKRARRAFDAIRATDEVSEEVRPRYLATLLDFSLGDQSLKALRSSLESEARRLGIPMRVTDTLLPRGPNERPQCIVCLGDAPSEFRKPALARMVQVLAQLPSDPSSRRITSRDTDLLLCLDATTFSKLSEEFPRKEVRKSLAATVVQEVGDFFRATGVVQGVDSKPIRAFRSKGPRLIDVYMTTSRRPEFFEKTFSSLLRASSSTHHKIRLNVFVDQMDARTWHILAPHLSEVSLLSTSLQLGLPFLYNMILDHQEKVDARTEEFADYLCYIQDDCLIANEGLYFDFMVSAYEELLPVREVGYVSGFYCSIHPGFEVVDYQQKKLLLSDSIDGKNFMAPPALLRSVGPLSWHFKDGERRGNPGPRRGSHFDLWQWKESPRALTKQGRVSVVVPGLCVHLAQSAEDSTWGNETSSTAQLKRRDEGRIYNTRGVIPPIIENQF
jgi:hypothetical protein